MCIHLSCLSFPLYHIAHAFKTYFTCTYRCYYLYALFHYLVLFGHLSILECSHFDFCKTLFFPISPLSVFLLLFFTYKCISLFSMLIPYHCHPLPLLLPQHNADDPSIIFINSALYCIYQDIFHRLPIGLLVMIFLKTCPFILFHSLC